MLVTLYVFVFVCLCVIIGFFPFRSLCRTELSLETLVTSHIIVLYRYPSAHKILKVKVKGQGHLVANQGCRRNPYCISPNVGRYYGLVTGQPPAMEAAMEAEATMEAIEAAAMERF